MVDSKTRFRLLREEAKLNANPYHNLFLDPSHFEIMNSKGFGSHHFVGLAKDFLRSFLLISYYDALYYAWDYLTSCDDEELQHFMSLYEAGHFHWS